MALCYGNDDENHSCLEEAVEVTVTLRERTLDKGQFGVETEVKCPHFGAYHQECKAGAQRGPCALYMKLPELYRE